MTDMYIAEIAKDIAVEMIDPDVDYGSVVEALWDEDYDIDMDDEETIDQIYTEVVNYVRMAQNLLRDTPRTVTVSAPEDMRPESIRVTVESTLGGRYEKRERLFEITAMYYMEERQDVQKRANK